MDFDKTRVFTALNADDLIPGSTIIVADTIATLRLRVEEDYTPEILSDVDGPNISNRFVSKAGVHWALAYLVSEPETSLKWQDLQVGDVLVQKRVVDMIDSAGNGSCIHIRIRSQNGQDLTWLSDGQLGDWVKQTSSRYKLINLNEHIKVKLTPEGEKIYKAHYHEEKYEGIPTELIPSLTPDKDGYVQFQLWDFMAIFGQHFHMCAPNPCDLDCLIEVKE